MGDDHTAAEKALLEAVLAELRWESDHSTPDDQNDPRKSWLRVAVDEVFLSGSYPGTRLVVRAHYRPDPSITTELNERVWFPEPGGGWSVSASPGITLTGLVEWVDTEVEVGDRRRR